MIPIEIIVLGVIAICYLIVQGIVTISIYKESKKK